MGCVPALPDLSPADLAAFSQKYGLEGELERLPSVGIVNRVYRAALNGQSVVLRVPMLGDDSDALTESVAAPAAFHAGVQTPELLVFDDDREVLDAPVTVYAFAPGRSLDGYGQSEGDPRLLRAYRGAGRELARLHAGVRGVPDPQGRLKPIGPPTTARTLARVTDSKRLGLADETWAMETVSRLLEAAPPPAPVFLHNDLHAGNLMVIDGGGHSADRLGRRRLGQPGAGPDLCRAAGCARTAARLPRRGRAGRRRDAAPARVSA